MIWGNFSFYTILIMSDTVRKMLEADARVLDASAGVMEYVASSEAIDSHGDKILLSGWRFNRMRTNAPFLDSHRKGSISDVLGEVTGASLEDGALVQRVRWAIGIGVPKIDAAFRMAEAGFLKAVSVGFQTVEVLSRFIVGRGGRRVEDPNFEQRVQEEFGVSAEEARILQNLFIEQEQIELSAVSIGANPEALVRSFEEGVISEKALYDLGFGDDQAYDFLVKAAAGYQSPECDEVMRALISREVDRTVDDAAGKEKVDAVRTDEERMMILKGLDDVTSATPCEPAGGVCAAKQADENRALLLKAFGDDC